MEVTGLKCNECERRIFLEDEESVHWATVVVTQPSNRLQKTIHYCPVCFGRWDETTQADEKLTTAQRKVIDPRHVDPQLEAMFQPDPEHDRDAEKSGVPLTSWPVSPSTGTPPVALPAPVALSDTTVEARGFWPGNGSPPPATGKQRVISGRPGKKRKKPSRVAAVAQNVVGGVTPVLAVVVGLLMHF